MSDQNKKKMKYESPVLVPLGALAKGSGVCTTGSAVVSAPRPTATATSSPAPAPVVIPLGCDCGPTNTAGTIDCTAGGTAYQDCSAGPTANRDCTAGTCAQSACTGGSAALAACSAGTTHV